MSEKTKALILHGRGISAGIAIGTAYVVSTDVPIIRDRRSDDRELQLQRYNEARYAAARELDVLISSATARSESDSAQILEIHKLLLEDEEICEYIERAIADTGYTAEYAAQLALTDFSERLANMSDPYMRARGADVADVLKRLIKCLLSPYEKEMQGASRGFPHDCIVFADDLSPSRTASLDRTRVRAIVTVQGSAVSHTAIIARSMGIPAVIGVDRGLMELICNGQSVTVEVNGAEGIVTVCPNEAQLEAARVRLEKQSECERLLKSLKGQDNVTRDGRRIDVFCNIGSAAEVSAALEADAGGIGLFRSELLFLESKQAPGEDEQFCVYRDVLTSMGDRPVIIRTLDIGADKQVDYLGLEHEENPALGLRASRLCLARPELLFTQLSALLRASVYGRLGIMFPMISSVEELCRVLDICHKVRESLEAKGVPVNKETSLGIMVETPAAAIISDKLSQMVDFFSIGTNDLTQYTLAIDRQNMALEPFLDTHHEAVLRLIELTVQNAHKQGIWVGICGELAADTSLTERFIRMGVDELSVAPSQVLRVRRAVRESVAMAEG